MWPKTASRKKRRSQVSLFHSRRFRVASVLIIVVITSVSLILWLDQQYSVEAKLLFLSRPASGDEHARFLLDREIQLLRSPEILVSLHRDLGWFSPGGSPSGVPKELAGAKNGHAHGVASLAGFGLSWGGAGFCEWLQDNLEIDQDLVGSQARVKLSLTGSDPEALRSVLNNYLKGYVAYRAGVEPVPDESERRLRGDSPLRAGNDEVSVLSEQLNGLDMQILNSNLALKLIKSGGVFSGFATDNLLKGLPSLSQFQDRIIQLEMQKRSLLVKFTRRSREVRAVESEINGVRGAMSECLTEHLNFLEKGREELQARKAALETKKGPFRRVEDTRGKLCFFDSRQTESWFCLRDGLCVIQKGPYVARRPIGIRTRECSAAILASLSDWGLGSPNNYTVVRGDWGVEAGAVGAQPGKVSPEETGSSVAGWLRSLDIRWLYSSGESSSGPDGNSGDSGLQPAPPECSGSKASRR